MAQEISPRLLTERDAARYLCVSRQFLRKSRCDGNREGRTPAPDYVRFGRTIRYAIETLDAWIERHRVRVRPGDSR